MYWSLARVTLAAVLAITSLVVLATPPAPPERFASWLVSLGGTLTATLALLAFDAWRTRRGRTD
ncbi:hypothetical protein [Amycolatopsis sp. NPDC049159]|uniref:hypothetical protein n=1 Tax=Amycolatopsis sp. NPDC049159 TaxID=3157210 RepID=UPI0033D04C71